RPCMFPIRNIEHENRQKTRRCARSGTWWPGSADAELPVALPHVLAAVRARKVHRIAFCGLYELANLVDPAGRQPALTTAALHGEAVCRFFVGPAELMPAFVREYPQFYR